MRYIILILIALGLALFFWSTLNKHNEEIVTEICHDQMQLSLEDLIKPLLKEMLPRMCHIESSGREDVVGDGGKAFGILQIHLRTVMDINRIYKTEYTHEDAFDKEKAFDMFEKYLMYGAKIHKNLWGVAPNEEQLVRMWNGGIYRGHHKMSTISYWHKYLKIKLSDA